jgi:Fic family protein
MPDLKPSYKLSPLLLNNIATIERLYGQIESLRLPKKLELNLSRRNMIQSSYASNKIEGNPLTLREVTNLLLDDRVPVGRDEKEVVNYYDLLMQLSEYREKEFSVSLLEEVHKKIMGGVDPTAGMIRNVPVVVGRYNSEEKFATLKVKHNPPFHKRDQIEAALSLLFSQVNQKSDVPTLIRAGLFHHEFVYIHPFEDGNGRSCRMLTALLFLKEGYAINKYFILDDYYDIDRSDYSDKLHTADEGDKTTWLEYFTDGVKYSLQSALSRVKTAMLTLKIEEQPSPKEREVMALIEERSQLTSHDIAKELNVSRQQAHALLRSLVDKGLLDKKGKTKSSYYFIK